MSGLRFVGVSKSYRRAGSNRRKTVLRDFSCEIRPGEFAAIVGPSGVGKSTLLHLAAGLDQPDAGAVEMPRNPEDPGLFDIHRQVISLLT